MFELAFCCLLGLGPVGYDDDVCHVNPELGQEVSHAHRFPVKVVAGPPATAVREEEHPQLALGELGPKKGRN